MKKQIVTALLCALITLPVWGANQKKVNSKVENVTVFLSGAQVFRSSKVSMSPGITEFTFHGLSAGIDPASVQAGGKGKFIILDVKHNIEHPQPIRTVAKEMPDKLKKEMVALEDSLVDLDFELQDIRDRTDALNREKKMLTENKLMTGGGRSDSLPILIDAMEFFRKKLDDINASSLALRKKERETVKQRNRIQIRLNELKNWKAVTQAEKTEIPGPDHQVIVTVSSDYATTGTIDLNYLVTQAGWSPAYDLRAKDVNEPVEITYKANVWQNSGKDWNDVKLKLSTANPRKGNNKPVLQPWRLQYYVANMIRSGNLSNLNMAVMNEAKDMDEAYFGDTSMGNNTTKNTALTSSIFSSRLNTIANFEFEIRLDYSIPADGKPHLVAVHNDKIEATYAHYCAPKVDKEAFLVAKVTDWEELNLLPGPANLYYDGTYIGKTQIDPAILSDTLELSLGRDQGLTVSRTKLKDDDKEKIIGSKKKKTITIELLVRNNKAGTVNLTIQDQIPVTRDKEIEVELLDGAGAELNENTGILTWKVVLPPQKVQKIKFTYTIKSDKDRQVI